MELNNEHETESAVSFAKELSLSNTEKRVWGERGGVVYKCTSEG
jgi:hypothetical protein